MNISSSQNTVRLIGFHVMMASMELPCHFSGPVSPPCLVPYPVSPGWPRAFHLLSVPSPRHTHAQLLVSRTHLSSRGKTTNILALSFREYIRAELFPKGDWEKDINGCFIFTRPEDLPVFFDDQKLSLPKCKPNPDIK